MAVMSERSVRERLVGCWRLVGFGVTAADEGETTRPLGDNPLGTILYTPDGYMSAQLARPGSHEDDERPDAYFVAYSGPFDVDERAMTVAHHVQVSVIPSWLGTTQLRQVEFREPDTLVLTSVEPRPGDGVTATTTVTWSRQQSRKEPTGPQTDVRSANQSAPGVERRLDGAVAILTIRYPPYNLLDAALSNMIIDGLRWAAAEGARAVVLRSALRHFSAGANLDDMLAAAESGDGVIDWPMRDVLRAFDELPIPIVAAVHGACVGGGLELALASDLVVAAESAKLGSVEAAVGLHPLMGAIQRIAQRAGAARAKEMAMLGRRYDARTLERWNVINRVVEDEKLEAAAMTLARELARGPTVAHAATKALVSIAVSEGVRAADAAMAELQRPIFRSEDFRAGVASFRENGPGMARFTGR
jgi:enoyl-CoA hydratase/carnithine racemase